jgi:hypothetical protein
MALINLNINNFKKDAGGIANRLVDKVVNKVEQKLENAVEDVFAKGLKKVGLSDNIAGELSARFGDAFSVGQADRFFGTSTAEQNRVSSRDCVDNILNRGAETVVDAQQSIYSKVQADEGLLQFPPDIGEYYMLMKLTEYARPSPQQVAVRKGLRNFILPVPRELKEQFTNNIDPKGMGTLAGGLADIGTDIFRGGGGENAKGQLEALAYSYAVQKVGDLIRGADDAIGQFGGAVPNPHLQAIFSGVQMRTHSFQWTFSPRNAVESRQLQQIIYELKKYSLPAFSNLGTAALQYPPLVDIELYPWKKNNEDLIIFKPCLIQNISVNYSPQGLPAFFKGTKQPTFIQISIDFMETEIQTAYDYGTKKGDRNDQATKLYQELKTAAADKFPGIADAVTEGVNYGTKLIDTASAAAQKANQ